MGIDFVPTLRPDGTLAEFEGKTLEYRRNLAPKDRIVRTLVAFANSAGGSLVVGVDDDHSLVGVGDPLVEENRLANMVAGSISPPLRPELEIVTVSGLSLLVAKVYPAGRRPFHVTAEGEQAGVYVRLGSSTLQADQWQIAELRRQSDGVVFDQLPCHGATRGLDDEAIARAFPDRSVESVKDVIGLTVDDQGATLPTNAGVLLFGLDRERLFYDAWVQCGRFRGPKGLDLADQVELYAPLLDLPDLVEAFLKKHAFRGADLSQWRRKDDWSVPLDILREAVINALVHSDYGQHGGPIRVAFYDDRVCVESLGGLLPGMTTELMTRGGVSRIRNPVIARAFRETRMIEQWGSGVRRMFDRADELGLPEPSYVEFPGRLRFVVPTHHAQIMAGQKPADRAEGSTLERSDEPDLIYLESPQVAALTAAADAPITRAALLDAIGVTNDSKNVRRHINPLLTAGLLERTDPNPRSPRQRYRLTEAGSAWLAEHSTGDNQDPESP